MTLLAWLFVAAVGVVLWAWLIWQATRRNGFFDPEPRTCLGCQRHFIRVGCPVHDRPAA